MTDQMKLICKHCGGKTGQFEEEFGEMVHKNLLTCVFNLKEEMKHMEYKKESCQYCGKERPANELKTTEVYKNGRYVEGRYCADDGCAAYAEMSAEG